ncbi:MAG: hypothetical protein ABWY94_01540, partial [Pseudoxanthomonas sp.]
LGGVRIGRYWIGVVPVLGIALCLSMMAPVLADIVEQVRRGDLLPATILVLYVGAGIAMYVFYGLRYSRRLALAQADGIA